MNAPQVRARIATFRASALALTLALAASNAQAGIALNLDLGFPDINAQESSIVFGGLSGSSGSFTVQSQTLAITFVEGGPRTVINNGSLTINALIDDRGGLVSGDIAIVGDLGTRSRGLLDGSLTAFGFNVVPAGFQEFGVFEFLFDVNGGALATDFGDVGGVILTGSSFDPIRFGDAGSFSLNATSVDVAPPTLTAVPEPSTFVTALIGLGVIGLAACRRRLTHKC